LRGFSELNQLIEAERQIRATGLTHDLDGLLRLLPRDFASYEEQARAMFIVESLCQLGRFDQAGKVSCALPTDLAVLAEFYISERNAHG
jgi:hypothetical protein